MDVLGGRGRPVAGLLGKLRDLPREVHRALAAQALEEIVRRALQPELALADQHVLEIAANRRHGDLRDRCRKDAEAMLLAGWPAVMADVDPPRRARPR